MGNKESSCFLCSENIDSDVCKCIRCNIKLHNYCEETYRSGKFYCECPHCRRIGTLSIYSINDKDFLD